MARLTILFILITILPLYVWGQGATENGQYFYHQENRSGNFSDQPGFAVDSVLFFYSKSGDTLTYWTLGLSTPYEKKELKKMEKQAGYGKFLQKGLALSDGRVTIHKLKPTKFLIRNDSLFQWSETYRLSGDSIKALRTSYESSRTQKGRDDVVKMIKDNTDFHFVFIFSPSLFDSSVEKIIRDKYSRCSNKVTLLSKWSAGKTDYYRFEITNDCGIGGHRWGYVVSGQFDFVTFGGYSSKDSKVLIKENLVWSGFAEH